MGICGSTESTSADETSQEWQPRSITVKEYKEGKILGNGASCQVVLAKGKTGKKVAIKILKRFEENSSSTESAENKELFMAECNILRKLNHPNILEFVDAYMLPKEYHLVTPYYRGGELFDKVVQGKFSERVASMGTRDMLRAVHHAHQKNIVHRDLKPENFVYESKDASSPLKLIDFGCALCVADDEKVLDVAGSPYYVAPEVLDRKYNRTGRVWKAADMWSMGVIIYLLVTGFPPFNGDSQHQIFARIKRGKYRTKDYLSTECKDLIAKLLIKDPTKRLTAEQALSHPWIADSSKVSDAALPDSVRSSLKDFVKGTRLKKAIGKILAGQMDDKSEKFVKEVFERFDKDKNGHLDAEEIKEMMDYIGKTAQEAQDLLKEYDDDNSGGIDFEEFKAFHASQKINESKAVELFRKADADNSGSLDQAELTDMLTEFKLNDQEIAEMIAEVDKDGDNKIDMNEWLTALMGRGKKKRKKRRKKRPDA